MTDSGSPDTRNRYLPSRSISTTPCPSMSRSWTTQRCQPLCSLSHYNVMGYRWMRKQLPECSQLQSTYRSETISPTLNGVPTHSLTANGVQVPHRSISRYANEFYATEESQWSLVGGAEDVITQLHNGLAVGLVTNFDHYPHVRYWLAG